MGSLSNYAETAFVNHLCGTSQTPPTTVYLALCTADPTDTGTGASMSEVPNSGAYARQAITFGVASSRNVTQSATVTYTQATGSWGTVTHWAIVDSATHGAGNMWAYGALGTSKSVVNGNTPSVASGQVNVTFSAGAWTNTVVHELLDHFFRNSAYTQPATYVGLTTTTSSDTAAGTEVSGGSYARVLVNKVGGASPAWATVSAGATSLNNTLTLTTATASWGTIVSTGIWDASTAGNLLLYMNDTADQAVASGDTVSFASSELDISVT